jgi:hypothetical protein
MEPTPLTAEVAIRIGGWHPSYARATKVATRADVAFAYIDTNGDGHEIEDTFYLWDGTSWEELGSNSWGTSPLAGWAHGYAPGRPTVELRYAGRRCVVPVAEVGEWWFVGRTPKGYGDGSPAPPELATDADIPWARWAAIQRELGSVIGMS